MGQLSGKLVNAALLIASIIFCVLVLEIGARVTWAYQNANLWGWGDQFRNFRYNRLLQSTLPIIFDAELGWVPKPNVQVRSWGTTETTVLADGTRSNGREIRDLADPILAVGDSFTFGAQVSDWETWPAQLENLSGRRVVNGGVDGYGVDQSFLRTRRLLSRYPISNVIFSFIPDDIWTHSTVAKFVHC
jgi:hypothetical protein